jgi:hypothetical protein
VPLDSQGNVIAYRGHPYSQLFHDQLRDQNRFFIARFGEVRQPSKERLHRALKICEVERRP